MTRDRVSDRGGATLAGADGWSVARGPAPATLDAVHLVQPLGIPGGGRPPRAARPPRDPPASGRPAGGRRDARPPRLDGLVSATGPGEGDGPPPGGAIFAAAALRVLGHRPRPLELEAVPDTDHVVAPFRVGGERQVALLGAPLPGAGVPDPAGAGGDALLRGVREPPRRPHAPPLFPARRPTALRPDSPRLDGDGRRALVDPPVPRPGSHIRLLTPAVVRALRRVDGRSCSAALVGYRAPLRALARGGGSLAQSRNTRTVESSAGKKHSILISWSVTSRGVPSVAMVVNRRSEVSPRRT